jgi:WD repeat-containing protein 49
MQLLLIDCCCVAGCVISWNINTGKRESRFFNAHGGSKVTSIAFDANERRLLSAANDGLVKIWNFNNGSLLRTYKHDEEPKEISKVFYIQDEKRGQECVYAAGWNRKVFIWEDADEVCTSCLCRHALM